MRFGSKKRLKMVHNSTIYAFFGCFLVIFGIFSIFFYVLGGASGWASSIAELAGGELIFAEKCAKFSLYMRFGVKK